MSLMAWFRRHNRKIMAFVVITLMIVFTIGPVMDYLGHRQPGEQKAIALYDDGKKISNKELAWGQKQLELLNLLGANAILRPQDPKVVSWQDLRLVLLGELLFSERSAGAETVSRVRQLVRNAGYPISDKQINDIYTKEYPSDIYWLLLVKETQAAGLKITIETAKVQLENIITRMQEGLTYSRYINAITGRYQVSEEQLLQTFAELMSVIEYGKMMCSIQNTTSQQILYESDRRLETLDVNFVQFEARTFAAASKEPTEEQIEEQFNKYKGYFAGQISEDNPYGCGYKLPERVQLEYMAVRLDDVAAEVPQVTQQETEDYYQQHRNLPFFFKVVPSDPNDPNSEPIRVPRSYAEVAVSLSKQLYQQRVELKAEQILLEAKSITEANLAELFTGQSGPTYEQIKDKAADYEKTARQVSEKYKVRVYSGKTGLLSPADIQADKNLGFLYLEGVGTADIGLLRLAFAVEPLKASTLGPFDVKPPRLYENIGPLKDMRMREPIQGYSGKNMILARIIRAEKPAEPQSVEQKINKRSVQFDQNTPAGEDSNSIRELVVGDLKVITAMDKAKEEVEKFVQLAVKEGWDAALDRFNKLYPAGKNDVNAPNKTFTLQPRTGLQRITEADIDKLKFRAEGDPAGRTLLNKARGEKMIVDKLFALVPADGNTLPTPGAILESKEHLSYYCIESLTVHLLYQDQFDQVKVISIMRDNLDDSQVLAAVHYNPENILKRTNFKLIRSQQKTASPVEPNKPNAPADTVE